MQSWKCWQTIRKPKTMVIRELLNETFAIMVPIILAISSSATTYYIFVSLNFPHARLFAGIMFVVMLFQFWGNANKV